MEIMINIDAIYGDEVQACWTDIVYVGVDHSRVKLERFIQMVEIDSLTALNYVTLCADIVHDGDFGAVTSDFTNAKKFIDSLTLNIEKYYNSSLEKSYPEIFKTCIKETIGNSEIDKLEFNKTAKNLMEKLNRRGLEK
uniref:Uncharacterized protein n=1 Tax=Panagrolaimus superbus TaxID=310955 RepID=A0A914XZ30_9BILA